MKLQSTDIRKVFKFNMNKDMNPFWNMDALLKEDRYVLDFDVYLPSKGMNLQRPLCWTLMQKQQLILSIIKENPIPKISVIQQTFSRDANGQKDKVVYEIIDGKQRLNAIMDFLKNKFAVEVKETLYFFSDLDEILQCDLNRYSPRGDVAYSYYDNPIPDNEKIAWFEQINFTGTPQDEQHLKNLLK